MRKVFNNIDFSNEKFPFMTFNSFDYLNKKVGLCERVLLVSWVMIYISPKYALELWKKFYYSKNLGLVPYGTETMHLLRAEKGYIVVGQDTDGTVTPIDLNLNWMIGKNKKTLLEKDL